MKIPKQHIAGLAALLRLSDEEVGNLTSSLTKKELSTDIANLTARVSSRLGAVSRDEAESILRVLVSLISVRADLGASVRDFVEDLARSMNETQNTELRLSEKEERFKEIMGRLLSFEPLLIASKVLYLKDDYEHSYCRARILTDARPIYGEDRAAAPLAAVIAHTLKLTYHEGNTLKDIHIAMDQENISSLKSLLERAETKAKSLKISLEAAHLPVVSE